MTPPMPLALPPADDPRAFEEWVRTRAEEGWRAPTTVVRALRDDPPD